MITIEELQAIMPRAGQRAIVMLVPIVEAMEEFDIDTLARQGMFLAQLAHESGELRWMEEIASGAAYDGRADLGNTHPEAIRIAGLHGSTPGRWWKGHGPIQITGYDNHLACGTSLGLDLMNFPKQLTLPRHGARSAAWFWRTNNLDRWADAGDFDGVCDMVNRGRKTAKEGDANGYADRLAYWQRAQEVLA